MRLSADKLKENLYQVLDSVLTDRVVVEVERKGHILKIMPEDPVSKLAKLEPHDTIIGEPESIMNIEWSEEWKGDENL